MATLTQARQRAQTIDWSFAGHISFWIEVSWLGAIAFVALLFNFRSWLPTFDELKTYTLHLFAFITLALMSWDFAMRYAAARKRGDKSESVDVLQWLRRDRSHWLIGAVAVFVFVYIASTALSPMPFYSFWGISPATSGYNLYSFLSMMVIFLSILIYVRSMAQVRRILYLIAGIGTLTSIHGTSQHFGWDPVGELLDRSRIFATFGNPIVFGAFLVISIPVTVALAVEERYIQRRWPLAVFAIAIGLQLGALWFTGSRGPLAGLVVSLAVTAALALTLLPRRSFIAYGATAAGSLVIAAILVAAPGGAGGARAVQFGGELGNLATEARAGYVEAGLEGRREIWREVLELSVTWERQYPDTGASKALRPVFGYGPDMLRFSSPLVSNPRASLEIVDHAHNRPLMVLAEQGWAGFVSFMAVVGIAGWLMFLLWRSLRSGGHPLAIVFFIAITGALTGVAVEQMTGVGRIADILTSWVLVALLVVLYKSVMKTEPAPATASVAPEPRQGRGGKKATATASRRSTEGAGGIAIAFLGATAISVIGFATFVMMDTQMFRASRVYMQAYSVADANTAYNKVLRAKELAPHVELYTMDAANLLLDDSNDLLELERHNEAADLAQEAYRQLSEYVQRNPLGLYNRLTLAASAAQMVNIGVVGWVDEMVTAYEDVADQFPNEGAVLAVTANAYVVTGDYDTAIEYADRAIAISNASTPLSQPWWIKGEALLRQSDLDGSLAALQTATEKQPDSEYAAYAHRSMASIYEALGDTGQQQAHLKAADEILYNGVAPGS